MCFKINLPRRAADPHVCALDEGLVASVGSRGGEREYTKVISGMSTHVPVSCTHLNTIFGIIYTELHLNILKPVELYIGSITKINTHP